MSASTGRAVTCEDYRLDPLGLRTHPECDFVRGANFGRVSNVYPRPKAVLNFLRRWCWKAQILLSGCGCRC